uniref:Small ribosomal subunit protein mS31 n=1 Tax=Strongyloides venezuelensis TaxID=75913 RepID=A0A0K0F736_STRVS
MFKKAVRRTFGLAKQQYRTLCSQSGSNLKDKDIIGEELSKALDNVADDLHKDNHEEKKKTRLSILSKLTESVKESFDSATGPETIDILHDKEMANLLNNLDIKPESKKTNKFVEIRKDTKAITALRKEIFYQAYHSGMSNEEAHVMAEKCVTKAEEKLRERRDAKFRGIEDEKLTAEEIEKEISEKERNFFEMAYNWMEKNLYVEQSPDDISESLLKEVEVDKSIPNIFHQTDLRLGIFNNVDEFKTNSLDFWSKWDLRAAEIANQSMGPTNKIEQQIEWTKEGKLWPYPIDNEYNLGEEQEVGFHDHIFLHRYLSKYNLPKTGPIAHFMELVCVGLSKNCYMTAAKKREHLDWFGKFFDSKRQESVNKLHEQEKLAAANSV